MNRFFFHPQLASGSVWQKIRQKIYKESYKMKKNGNSPDQSTNREDVYDDVDDHQLV